MDTLRRIRILLTIMFLVSCSDHVKNIDSQNFEYINIIGYPQKTNNAKLIFYQKNSNFKINEKSYTDFSFNYYTVINSADKALGITLNFDNSAILDSDLRLIIDDKYYYEFTKISVNNIL